MSVMELEKGFPMNLEDKDEENLGLEGDEFAAIIEEDDDLKGVSAISERRSETMRELKSRIRELEDGISDIMTVID